MSQQASSKIIAGDVAILARRYAGALYELAEEQNQIDAIAADLRVLKKLQDSSPEFRAPAENPRLTRAQLVDVARKITVAGKLNPLTGNFLARIAENRRLSLLGAMIDSFLRELTARRGECTADVRTATPLSAAQRERLSLKLHEAAGGKVHVSLQTDPSLLGGLVVRMGSRMIDASLRTKLARLKRQLKSPTTGIHKGVA